MFHKRRPARDLFRRSNNSGLLSWSMHEQMSGPFPSNQTPNPSLLPSGTTAEQQSRGFPFPFPFPVFFIFVLPPRPVPSRPVPSVRSGESSVRSTITKPTLFRARVSIYATSPARHSVRRSSCHSLFLHCRDQIPLIDDNTRCCGASASHVLACVRHNLPGVQENVNI